MKRIICVLVVVLLISGCDKGLSKKNIAKYKEEGLMYLAEEEYEKAIESLSLVLEYDDDEYTITFAYVEANTAIEDYPTAIKALENLNDAENSEIRNRLITLKGSNLLKNIASVDWETMEDTKWTYVGAFNDEYFKYGIGEYYGLLDWDFNVVLEAQYYDVFTLYGPYKGQVFVYKNAKDYATNDIAKAVILDSKLKETKSKIPSSKWGKPSPKEYFVDVSNSNIFMRMESYKVAEETVTEARTVSYIDKDMVVVGAQAASNKQYERKKEYYLVYKKDLSVHKLLGTPQHNYDGYFPDRSIVNDMIAVQDNGRCGYYNLSSIIVSSFIYSAIGDNEANYICNSYSQGYVVVYDGYAYGLMDKNGKLVTNIEFTAISNTMNDRFIFIYQDRIGIATLR